MCGRYGLYDISESNILLENQGYAFKPNYNVAPTQTMPVITASSDSHTVSIMQWGIKRKLGPNIEKDIFNTRSEKALERFWGKTVRSHRCLVPANGFYEWRKTPDGKIPFWIHAKDHELIYFAGIYDVDAAGTEHYSIMTTTPNIEMADIHDRMPVILDENAQDIWLQGTDEDTAMISELLQPLPDHSLEMFEVSREVNVVKNNHGKLMLPVNTK
jgi:putative SOS response-associated peptidase YedK